MSDSTYYMTTYVSDETHEKVSLYAEQHGISINSALIEIIESAITLLGNELPAPKNTPPAIVDDFAAELALGDDKIPFFKQLAETVALETIGQILKRSDLFKTAKKNAKKQQNKGK